MGFIVRGVCAARRAIDRGTTRTFCASKAVRALRRLSCRPQQENIKFQSVPSIGADCGYAAGAVRVWGTEKHAGSTGIAPGGQPARSMGVTQ